MSAAGGSATLYSRYTYSAMGHRISEFERHYRVVDWRGVLSLDAVSAIIASDGTLVEQVRYSAAGVPFNIPLGEGNGDGPPHTKVEAGTSGTADEDQIKHLESVGPYHVRGDLDDDLERWGDVDAADLATAQAMDGTKTGRGRLSRSGADHRILMPKREFEGNLLALHRNTCNESVVHVIINVVLNETSYPDQLPGWTPPPADEVPPIGSPIRGCWAGCYNNTNEYLFWLLKPYNYQGPGQGSDSACYKAAQRNARRCCVRKCTSGELPNFTTWVTGCEEEALRGFECCGDCPSSPPATTKPADPPPWPGETPSIEVMKDYFSKVEGCFVHPDNIDPVTQCQDLVSCLVGAGRRIEPNPIRIQAYKACCQTGGVSVEAMFLCVWALYSRDLIP